MDKKNVDNFLLESQSQYPVIKDLSKSEIEEIFDDFELKKLGYNCNFVIDANEINEYFFPTTNNINKVSKEKFLLNDLLENNKGSIVVLQEYYRKLISIRTHLLSTSNIPELKETQEKYAKILYSWYKEIKNLKFEERNDKYIKNIVKALPFLLSISENKFKHDLKNFSLLINSGFLFEGQEEGSNLSKILNNFKVEDYSDFLKEMGSNYDLDLRTRYDLQAILKTYILNKKSAEIGAKEIFYFVSSKTKNILDLKKKIGEDFQDKDLFKLESGSSIIRTNSQLFASLVFKFIKENEKGTEESFIKLVKNKDNNKEVDLFENLTVLSNSPKRNNDIVFEIQNFRDLIQSSRNSEIISAEEDIIQIIKRAEYLINY